LKIQASFVEFHALRHLKIRNDILLELEDGEEVHKSLPRGLQTLEVYNDGSFSMFALKILIVLTRSQSWLDILAKNKLMCLPDLATVCIMVENPLGSRLPGVRRDRWPKETMAGWMEKRSQDRLEPMLAEMQKNFESVGVVFTAEEVTSPYRDNYFY